MIVGSSHEPSRTKVRFRVFHVRWICIGNGSALLSSIAPIDSNYSLLDENAKDDFCYEVSDEYEDIRRDHYDKLSDRKYLSIQAARQKGLSVDWSSHVPVRPSFTGKQNS